MSKRQFWRRAALASGLYWTVFMWLLGHGIVIGIILGVIQIFITLWLGGMAISAGEADERIEDMMWKRLGEDDE